MTVQEMTRAMRAALTPIYGRGEADAMIRLIFTYIKGWKTTDLLINADRELSASAQERMRAIVERLKAHEPIQYITGIAPFYGMDLHVDRRVLIPRPETETLVDMIADTYGGRSDLQILDIATGSGCIAIALARTLPFSHVTAIDASAPALEVAKENVREYGVEGRVTLLEADLFSYCPPRDSLDIVVSNPPYITQAEKAEMDRNVLDYEPDMALFAPADDPVGVYGAIVSLAAGSLRPGGRLYLEINPLFARQIRKLVSTPDWEDGEIVKDIHGRERYVVAKLKDNG